MKTFTVAAIQMACQGSPDENLARACAHAEAAAADGARVICLPELFRSPYFCQVEDAALFDLAEPVPGPSTEALGGVAKKAGVTILAPIFERRAAGVYHNTVVVLGPDGAIAGKYRKMHIPDDPGFYEKFYFTPGDTGFRTFHTPDGPIGALICWDQWFPEAARLTALQGAAALFYPTAIGWHPAEKAEFGQRQQDAWRTVQRGHAIANGCYVVSVNRIGHEVPNGGGPGIEFWGSSFICDPFGVVMGEAGTAEETTLLADIDIKHLEDVRRHWPFLRDRRIDAYGGLTERVLDDDA